MNLALEVLGTGVRSAVLTWPRYRPSAAEVADSIRENSHPYDGPASGSIYFLSRDPAVATTLSPYGYVAGNPLNGSDPSGLDFNLPFGGLCVHFFLGSSNCQGSLSQDVVKSGAFQAANGFANGFSFGLSTKVEDAFGAAPNTSSGCFQGGSIGGNVAGIALIPGGAARAIGAGLRELGIGTRLAIHDAHHAFGVLGDLPHIQLNWWRIGVKGSGGVIRIPLPPIWPFS